MKSSLLEQFIAKIFTQARTYYTWLEKFNTDAKSWFTNKESFIQETAFRNSSLQAAYFMITARAFGLDCGPMSGFDRQKGDELFFQNKSWRSNLLCNFGYGNPKSLHPRLARLNFNDACQIV